jgi:hypothetical protein
MGPRGVWQDFKVVSLTQEEISSIRLEPYLHRAMENNHTIFSGLRIEEALQKCLHHQKNIQRYRYHVKVAAVCNKADLILAGVTSGLPAL